MRIFLVTISSDYLMSDHWSNLYNEQSQNAEAVKNLLDWNYDNNEMSAIVLDAEKMMTIEDILKNLGIQFKYENIADKYSFHTTNAPQDYDGFGTLTIFKSDNQRTIAILNEHKTWQSMRYASGLYFCEPFKD